MSTNKSTPAAPTVQPVSRATLKPALPSWLLQGKRTDTFKDKSRRIANAKAASRGIRFFPVILIATALTLPSLAMAAPPAQPIYYYGGVNNAQSANAPAIPEAGFVLLTTIPINGNRATVEVQNQSAGTIQLVLDDGLGTAGTVGSTLLNHGTGANTAGQTWTSDTFKGRARIYGAAGAQVLARQN